jgi:hypothetical protein
LGASCAQPLRTQFNYKIVGMMKKENAIEARLEGELFDLWRKLAERGRLEAVGDDQEPHLRALLSV